MDRRNRSFDFGPRCPIRGEYDVNAPMPSSAATATGGWELFSHDADIGVRGYGRTEAAAFENVARAMTASMTDPAQVRSREMVRIACEAPDREILLVDWLNALVYEMATRGMVFGDFKVNLSDGYLEAEARGEQVDISRHAPAVEVKGATYTELKVARGGDGTWTAQCVIDV
jgi:tRNA nucleotidyltransferase (CCA-adding enzyme)